MIDLLKNPTATPAERITFPGLDPLPELGLHSMFTNTLTGQPLLMDNPPHGINYDIPAVGISPFVDGAPDRPLDVPLNETDFIVDRVAAVRLGKALFWDMQLGSDGVQACASCHFQAGADSRTKNQLNPGTNAGDNSLQVRGPNEDVVASDFPFHKLANVRVPGEPLLNPDNVLSDANDVMSSMGVRFRQFIDIPTPGPGAFLAGTNPAVLAPDLGADVPDPIGGAFQGFRRVEPRNTPTLFSAAFNYDNFWDGRARHDFNGGNPHGASDPVPHILEDNGLGLTATRQIIRFSSMASLATGPALSNFEMSFDGRNWAKIGKKLLQAGVTPLANQLVDPNDSALGPFSNQNITPGMPGLSVSYATLIEQAFGSRLWSNSSEHLQMVADPADPFDGVALVITPGAADAATTTQFTQMEGNFSLFFGLAVQAFTQILLPNDSAFDRFHDANPNEFLGLVEDIDPNTPGVQVVGMSERQLLGYDLFQGSNLSRNNPLPKKGNCNICHFGPNLTENSLFSIQDFFPPDLITGEDKTLTGFLLEDSLNGNAQVSMEIDAINPALDAFGFSEGIALVDKGIYNIGVRPSFEDIGRGADDAFGFPLAIAALSLQNAGFPVGVFSDPNNPVPPLPPHLAPFINDFPIGAAFPDINQTVFLPDVISPSSQLIVFPVGTYPNPNRIARNGNFKVPQLKNVELTGPYFHNGGMLTLRQVIDFYARGGDFPSTNAADRDPLILDLHAHIEAGFTEADKDALVDFLLAMTDERVKFERAPFDHPEVILPVDGLAPDNTLGRGALLSDARFVSIPATGAAGRAEPLPNFLGISSVQGSPGPDHFDSVVEPEPVDGLVLAHAVPGTAGTQNSWLVSGATPGRVVGIYSGLSQGASILNLGNCGGIPLGLNRPLRLIGKARADAAGMLTIQVPVPAGAAGRTFHLQAVEPSTCQASNVVSDTFLPGSHRAPRTVHDSSRWRFADQACCLDSLGDDSRGGRNLTRPWHTPVRRLERSHRLPRLRLRRLREREWRRP